MNVHKKIGTKERFLEMFQNVNKIKITESEMWGEKITNENFDSPKEKDKKYLDKTVGDQSSQVSKYDDGTRYPVEDKLKVKDPSLEKLKGDDAPIKEGFEDDEDNSKMYNDGIGNGEEAEPEDNIDVKNPEADVMSGEEEPEEGGAEEKPAWDENYNDEESGLPNEDEVDALPADDAEQEAPELSNEIGDGSFEDQLDGGLADDAQPSEFCPVQIAKGIQIEMEHTDDPHKALEIAMDHLVEIPDYYDRLESMEAEAKGESGESMEDAGDAPEDALLDPSKHWVDDYAPSNVADEGINYPSPLADPEAGEEEHEEMEKLKRGEFEEK